MRSTGEVWRLVRGTRPLGEIEVREVDFPWLVGRFTPDAGFEEVRSLFEAELSLLEEGEDGTGVWVEAYQRLRDEVTLIAPDGQRPEFLLHIEGHTAWFRWSTAPLVLD
ncbi:hypothetical protein [Streptomyces sp. NPDC005438]|uniref:hypothetical protein n=1 Tax=Streptomyces sp. NPDC005438 TaxID=3156880 RepID=UPI0033A3E24D